VEKKFVKFDPYVDEPKSHVATIQNMAGGGTSLKMKEHHTKRGKIRGHCDWEI
jgi:hypothetical protein